MSVSEKLKMANQLARLIDDLDNTRTQFPKDTPRIAVLWEAREMLRRELEFILGEQK
jgi:capsule polysaccharide export protein KpsE/RkpR